VFVLLLTTGLVAGTPPIEIVIDLSSWHGKVDTRFIVRFEARDGSAIRSRGELPAGTDPGSPRTGLRILLGDNNWQFEYEANFTVIVRGSSSSPVKSVTFWSDGWVPTYILRFATRPFRELAPKPREVKQ
jgi:hypothetical protein